MYEAKFWEVIQSAHDQSGGHMDEKCELLKDALVRLSREDAVSFSKLFDAMMDRAYAHSLWGAAYVINGGCSDDTFSDFRASLISRGRRAFESALADPDSMADEDFDEDSWFYEGYQYAVTDGVIAAAGAVPEREKPHPAEPSGEEWSEEDVYDRYPRLSEKFA